MDREAESKFNFNRKKFKSVKYIIPVIILHYLSIMFFEDLWALDKEFDLVNNGS